MYLTLSPVDAARRDGTDGGDGTGRRRRPVGRVVLTLGIVSLLTDISSESVSSILPLYLTAAVGLSPAAYGLVDGFYQGGSALVRIAAGWAADRSGRPWWVAVVGYGVAAFARGILLLTTGVAAVAGLLALDRVGKGIRTAPRDAMIAASSDPAHLGRAFGVHRTLDTLGAAIGPVLAALVLWLIPDGYATVLVMSFGFAVLGVAVLGLFVPTDTGARGRARAQDTAEAADTGDTGEAASEPRPRFRWREVTTPALRRLMLVAGALALLGVGDGFVYLTLFDAGDFATHWFPLLYVGTNVVFLLLALPLGRVADRVGRARMLIAGHVALAAAYVAAALASGDAVTTLLTLTLLGTFYAATDGVLPALAAPLVAPHVRTSGIATAQTVVTVGRLLSSIAFGLLWLSMGPQQAMACTAVALALVVPLAWLGLRSLDRSPHTPDHSQEPVA